MGKKKAMVNFHCLQLWRKIPRNYIILDLGMEGDAVLMRFAVYRDFFTFSTTYRELT